MRPSKPQVGGSSPPGDAKDSEYLQEANDSRDTRPATQPATWISFDAPEPPPDPPPALDVARTERRLRLVPRGLAYTRPDNDGRRR